MDNKDRFSKFGAKLGEKLDNLSDKLDESGIKDEAMNYGKKLFDKATELGNKAVELGGEAVKNVAERLDDTPKEEKYCVACGKRINSKRVIKIADGELCKECSAKYDIFAKEKKVSLANMTFDKLDKKYKIYESEKKKKTIIIIIICVIAMLLCYGGLMLMGKKEHEGKLQIPEISSVYYGNNVEEAKKSLEDYGFTNIWTEELKDLEENQKDKENTVDSITIEGSNKLSTDDWVEPTAKVVIYYHSLKPIEEVKPVDDPKPVEENNDNTTSESSSNSSNNSGARFDDLDKYVETLQVYLNSTEPDEFSFTASRIGGVVYVSMYMDGTYDLAYTALNGNSDSRKDWNTLMDTCKQLNQKMKDGMDESGLSKYTMVLQLLDDTNTENVLAKFTDGRKKFDAVND